jgi:RNA polymerase sigma factor (sigma-70 family)
MEVTDGMLDIPRRVAKRYARPGSEFYEELVAVGNLALLGAVASYDEGKGCPLDAWLTTYVWQRVYRSSGLPGSGGNNAGRRVFTSAERNALMERLDEPFKGDDHRLLGDTLPSTRSDTLPPDEQAASTDYVEWLLSPLTPTQRKALELRVLKGLTRHQAAAEMGMSDYAAHQRFLEAMAAVRPMAMRGAV